MSTANLSCILNLFFSNCSFALTALVETDGWVDRAMMIGRYGMFNIIKKKWADWNLQENGNLLKDLKRRGVDKPGILPNYYYRDDAKLLWEAIEKYVTRIVNHFYGMYMYNTIKLICYKFIVFIINRRVIMVLNCM